MSEKPVNYTDTFDREMYHTQEKWKQKLIKPVKTNNPEAWLGFGYYFWDSEDDAIEWGRNSKRKTGYFEVYKAHIISEKILDTVFNREHYEFWVEQINKVAERIIKKTDIVPTTKEINEYFKERAYWDVDGILSQDIPISKSKSLVKGFFYKKRIQLVVYNEKILITFEYYNEWRC